MMIEEACNAADKVIIAGFSQGGLFGIEIYGAQRTTITNKPKI